MTLVYIASPIDQVEQVRARMAVEQVTNRLLRNDDGRLSFYTPLNAFASARGGPLGNSQIQEVNFAALDRCDLLVVALWPNAQTVGCYVEIGYARARGIPTVIVHSGIEQWDVPTALQGIPCCSLYDLPGTVASVMDQPVAKPKLLVKKAHAGLPGLSIAQPGDAGYDLAYCGTDKYVLHPGHTYNVPTGLSVQLPPNTWGWIVGRSSTFRNKGLLVNTAVIDEGYRGELFFTVHNLGDEPYDVQPGERLAQLIVMPRLSETLSIESVSELSHSARGNQGFGSTG